MGCLDPTISIDGVLKCDYYDYEIVGSSSEGGNMSKGMSMSCGWQGGVVKGKMFDHEKGLIL